MRKYRFFHFRLNHCAWHKEWAADCERCPDGYYMFWPNVMLVFILDTFAPWLWKWRTKNGGYIYVGTSIGNKHLYVAQMCVIRPKKEKRKK